jgi:hypothetical protein
MTRQTLWIASIVLLIPAGVIDAQSPATQPGKAAVSPAAEGGSGSAPSTPATTTNPTLSRFIEEELKPLPSVAALNTQTGELMSNEKARGLIDATLGTCNGATRPPDDGRCGKTIYQQEAGVPAWRSIAPQPDAKDFYCLINVVRWDNSPLKASDGGETGNKIGTAASSRWYVYHGGKTWGVADFKTNNRVFGVRRVWLLFVHLNPPGQEYEAYYTVDVTKKLPLPLTNLLGMASFVYGAAGGPAIPHGWGGGYVDVVYNPSDLAVTGFAEVTGPSANSFQKLGDTQIFSNEGKYHFDFSFGVPIKQISQLQLNNTNNTVSAQKVDKTNVFGLLDLFPQAVDISNAGLYRLPHAVVGVKLDKQPLHSILLGVGFGPAFANFYAGCLWVKQDSLKTLQSGQGATPVQQAADTQQLYKPQFAFGINLTVRGTLNAMKKVSQ